MDTHITKLSCHNTSAPLHVARAVTWLHRFSVTRRVLLPVNILSSFFSSPAAGVRFQDLCPRPPMLIPPVFAFWGKPMNLRLSDTSAPMSPQGASLRLRHTTGWLSRWHNLSSGSRTVLASLHCCLLVETHACFVRSVFSLSQILCILCGAQPHDNFRRL